MKWYETPCPILATYFWREGGRAKRLTLEAQRSTSVAGVSRSAE